MRQFLIALSLLGALFSCSTPKEPIPEAPKGWEVFQTPVKSSLRGLSPLTKDIAWASGSNGTWLRTIDGGKTWDHGVIAGLDSVDFRSIHAFDAENAVAVSAGQPAVIYRTADGGKTWLLKHQEGEQAFLDGISFANQDTGYVIGDPVNGKWTILKTVNKGETWYSLLNLPDAVLGEGGFAASASSLLAIEEMLILGSGGSEANLYISENGGDQWRKYNSTLIQGESSQGIFAVTAIDKSQLFALGGDYLKENDSIKNSGKFILDQEEWIQVGSPPKGYRSGVTFFPGLDWLIAVGPSGSDFSKDSGVSWLNFSQEGFHSVKIGHTEASIWASGANGKVAKLKY
jgi:photosystem II stability/assembly factor-like uncharacterized protein